jgi:TonB family protein
VSLPKAALLALVLPGASLAATPLSPERSAQLTTFCSSARPLLLHDALDPGLVSAPANYVAPRPTVVMGQKVQAASRRLAMEGSVVLGLVINSVGRTAYASVLEKSEYAELDREALAILKDTDFAPATLDGEPVRACTIIKVVFKVVA